MGIIAFYNGNSASQDVIQAVEDYPGQDFRPREDDAIKSAKLYNVRPGCEIRVFDSGTGNMTDDFCVINVKRAAPEYTLHSFEKSYEDEYVRVTYIPNDGLDGKVSRVRVN
jgi:hypothetical protein